MDELKKCNLLFVEDNEEFAKNTTEFLKAYFKKVIHVSTIKDAILHFKEYKVDVIFTDIKLSDGNGLDFIIEVRGLNKLIPIVVLSAHKDEEFLFKTIPLSVTAYELKPIAYEPFMELLRKVNRLFIPHGIFKLSKNTTYDRNTLEINKGTNAVSLTKKEAQFIDLLLAHEVLKNETIQREIYEDKIMSDASIKNLLLRLRKKVGAKVIITLSGVGYKLV